ncbi:MAG: hypothetical protein K0U68_10290 [Gammaproteobacteria bacterium]|nr:hypothetical protein [Gammaproteobacteria bacterium]
MKLRKKHFEIFNLSFLDVISCGFGAVIMLVLISKTKEDVSDSAKGEVENLLKTVITLNNTISQLEQRIDIQSSQSNQLKKQQQRMLTATVRIDKTIQKQQSKQAAIADSAQGLSLVQSTLKQASITTPETKITIRDKDIGGIPVNSDYVIFIVDTSGSMQRIWSRVSSEIINVLNIHPKVKGFQILNDMGKPIVSGYAGKWIEDKPWMRESLIKRFARWSDMSNSSPVEGIQIALQRYAKPGISTSIYIFGDDYTGSSYGPVITKITSMNTASRSAKQLAKIHAVGFVSPGTTNRFGILMRELTKQNGGAFLALPL